jgi:TolA-binding protein
MRHVKVLCVAAAALFATATAEAQPKYNRKTVDIKVQQTDATKKLEARKSDKEKAVPELTADQFFVVEGAVQNIQDEVIDNLKDLINETDDKDPEKADLLFRLAEAYANKVRYWHFRGMEALGKSESPKTPKGDRPKYKSESNKALGEEKKWLVQAVKIYKAIAENPRFKNYPRMDEALFYYAYTLTQAKYQDQARSIYHRLIKDYPSSRFIPDAYLSFAEFYFKQENDLNKAEKFYDKVLEFPKARVYVYALYMKGWVYYNQARPQDSLETWFKVAQLTQNDKKQGQLNRYAKKDFVRAYADVGKAELAYKAFQRVDQGYAFKMLGFLGEYYLSQGKWEKTIYVYRQMMDAQPKDKQVCEWQYTVVRAMMSVGTPDQKVKEIERLAKLYKFVKEGKILPEQPLQECRDNAQATTGELAKIWHQEGLKTLNYETLGYVHRLYKLYQEYFPDAPDAAEMQFYYAELLWKRAEGEKNPSLAAQRWEEAAYEYNRFVDMKPKDQKLLKESAYATVLAWKNALAVDIASDVPAGGDDDKKGKGAKDDDKPEPIPEKEQKMIAAFDVYMKYITDTKDDELVDMKFFKGRIFWKHKHYDEAIPFFEDVIKTRPDHPAAEFASNLLLDSLSRAGREDELLKWVDRMVAMPKLLEGRDDLRQRLGTLKSQGMRKLAERYEKDGKYLACGELYLEIFNKYTDADDLDEMLYNAGVCFEKAKSLGLAVQMRKALVDKFGDPKLKNPLAAKAKFALGLNYAAIAYYGEAATQFEEYAKRFGGEKNASEALSNATFFRRGLGQDSKAIEDTEAFIKQYGRKDPKEAAAAFFSLLDVYEKKKDYKGLVKHLNEYLKRFGKTGGVDRQMAAHVKIGEVAWRESCPVKGVNGACVEIKREKAIKMTRKEKKRRGTDQKQCGEKSKTKVVLHKRRPAQVSEAQKHFRTAIKLWGDGAAASSVGGKDEDEKKMRGALAVYWYAAANFYLAEDKYENVLDIEFPDNLDFSDKNKKKQEESKKKFTKWKDTKEKALADAQKQYFHVVNDIKGGGAHWAIASAARIGQLFQNYSGTLFTAEIPALPQYIRDLARQAGIPIEDIAQDFVDAYCDAMVDLATPLEEKSISGFSFCLEKSTDLNWFNEWSRLCEGELAQIRPQDFPTAGEIRAEPLEVPTTLDVQTVQAVIDTGKRAAR